MSETSEHDPAQALADVHTALIRTFLKAGYLPATDQLAASLQISPGDLAQRMNRLAEFHGLVLHPHVAEPWVVHPFSTTPTPHYVEGQQHGWWAPCIWCALGIAQLAGGKVRIHTCIGAETEPLIVDVEDGVPSNTHPLFVHFSIPPRQAWNNVHHHCSLVLPFRTEEDIHSWCGRHGQRFGEAVTLEATATLARRWYGPYAETSWRKWTVEQAQQIFQESGLTSSFWELSGKGTY
jgi:hypothetical protein